MPEGVFTVIPGQRLGGGGAVRHPPVRPQDLLHRVDRGREDDHEGLRRPGQAVHPRARRQERERDLRRRRHRRRRRRRAPYAVFDNAGQDCCARSRILVQESVRRGVPRSAAAARSRPWWSPIRAQEDAEMGPLISAAQTATACRGSWTRWTSRSPVTRPAGPGFWLPPSVVLADSTAAADLAGGGLRSGRRGAAVPRRGRGGRRWPTTPSTACRARSSPAIWAGRCACRGPSRPAT